MTARAAHGWQPVIMWIKGFLRSEGFPVAALVSLVSTIRGCGMETGLDYWLPGCGITLGCVGLARCPCPGTVSLVSKHLPLPELGHPLCWEDEDASPPHSGAGSMVARAWEDA